MGWTDRFRTISTPSVAKGALGLVHLDDSSTDYTKLTSLLPSGIGKISSRLLALPPELILIIIDLLAWSDLRSMSVGNRVLNELSNKRLWRTIKVNDWPGEHPPAVSGRRELLTAICNAIIHDPKRALNIRCISVRVHFTFSAWPSLSSPLSIISLFRDALLLVRNLHTLDLTHMGYHHEHLCTTLSSIAQQFPFRLVTLNIHDRMYAPLKFFIRSQKSIENFAVYRQHWPEYPRALSHTGPFMLPAMRHFRGHWETIRPVTSGRNLDSIEVLECESQRSLQGVLCHEWHHDTSPNTPMDLEQVAKLPSTNVESLKLSVGWTDTFDASLAHFISCPAALGVALPSIKQLHITSERWPLRPQVDDTFCEALLPSLSSLLDFEWVVSHGEPWPQNDTLDYELAESFARSAAFHCESIERITWIDYKKQVASFVRTGGGAATRRGGAYVLDDGYGSLTKSRRGFVDSRSNVWIFSDTNSL